MVPFHSIVDGRLPGVVSTIQRRASTHQETNDREVPGPRGEMEWRLTTTVRDVDLGARHEERSCDIDVSPCGGNVESRSALSVSRIGPSSLLEHILHDSEMAEIGGSM